MQAIILAAGSGNRMRPLTDACHKTLIRVGEDTIIGHIVDGLLAVGVSRIVCVTGYRADEVESYLRDRYPELDFQFVRNERFRSTNNIFSMALALDSIALDEDILLVESDLVCEPRVFARLVASPHPNVALVDRYRTGMDGTVVSIADGIITQVIPSHLQTGDFSFAEKYKTLNLYKFAREFCKSTLKPLVTYYAKTIDENCYYELVLGILIYVQRAIVHAEVIGAEKWAEVDDPNDLRAAEFLFNPARQSALLDETMGGYWSLDITDFCFIRNMYFPTPSILAELKNNLPRLLQNYGSRQEVLNQKLAFFLLCDPARLQVLNGASQLFPTLAEHFGGQRVLLPEPTFGEYTRAFPQHASYPDTGTIDMEHVAAQARKAALVVFVNPNNPTGTTLSSRRIYEFARRHRAKTVLVDESFLDFAAEPSVLSLLEERSLPNLLVLKSLSKALGVPGVRLGYVYSCDPVWHERIRRWLPVWNLNSVAECILEVILKHRPSHAEAITRTMADRSTFAQALARVPLIETIYNSGANFLLITLIKEAPDGDLLRDWLLAQHGIYVKNVSRRFSDGKQRLRLSVRLPSENERLCQALAGVPAHPGCGRMARWSAAPDRLAPSNEQGRLG